MKVRVGIVASLLIPLPFLIGMVMLIAAFWQNDADFFFGNTVSTEVVLVDQGPAHTTRGRPLFFPTVKLADGRLLTLERASLATELPPTDQAVYLECSTKKATNCKFTKSSNNDYVFYGIAIVWSLFAIVMIWTLWLPLGRKLLINATSKGEEKT